MKHIQKLSTTAVAQSANQ